MKRLKGILVIAAIASTLCVLGGCQTYQAYQGSAKPTQEQLLAAQCADAKDLVLAADLALALATLSAEQRTEWQLKRSAAQAVVNRYCGGQR